MPGAYRTSFLEDNLITQVVAPTAGTAETTDITSSSVDMSKYEEVVFVCTLGAITSGAVTSLKVQQSADDSSFADLEGTGMTIADSDDNTTIATDLIRPTDRYVRVVIDRATQNAVVQDVVAFQCRPRTKAVTQTITTETHKSPAEGTA